MKTQNSPSKIQKLVRCIGAFLAITIILSPVASKAAAPVTYDWVATSTSSIANPGNWSPLGGPPGTGDSVTFGMGAPTNTNAEVTGTFQITNAAFTRATGQTSILGSGSTATFAVSGNLTNSGGGQFILRQASANTLSVSVSGNMNLNSGITRFGVNTSTGNNSQISSVTVLGTTNLTGRLSFGTIIGTALLLPEDAVNLGNVVMAGGILNPISGSDGNLNNGTANGSTNTINMNRLDGTGTIEGFKELATLPTTGIIHVNGTTDGTFSGAINNGSANNVIAFTKSGSSRQTFSGTNTYTGATTINGGTLLISSTGSISNSSAVTVGAGGTFIYNSSSARTGSITLNGAGPGSRATLGGTGQIDTALTLNNLGDTLSPGNSPGILPFGVSQNWESFTYEWELNTWSDLALAGVSFDQISIDGSLNLSSASPNSIRLELISLLGDNTPGLVPGFSETNRQWVILETTGGITGFDSIHWDIVTTGFTSSPTWAGGWSVTANANQIFLNYTAIPEPSTGLMILLGVGLFVIFYRRRQLA